MTDHIISAVWPSDPIDLRRARLLLALGRVYGLRADMAFANGLWARADEYNQRAIKAMCEASTVLGPDTP